MGHEAVKQSAHLLVWKMAILSASKLMMLLLLALSSQAAAEDRAGSLLEGDLDDTTLALPCFGGGKTESKPAKKSTPNEASGGDGAWLTNFLGRLGGGATPTTGQSKS